MGRPTPGPVRLPRRRPDARRQLDCCPFDKRQPRHVPFLAAHRHLTPVATRAEGPAEVTVNKLGVVAGIALVGNET